MPSDARTAALLALVEPHTTPYRSAVRATMDEVRRHLTNEATSAERLPARVGAELGAFAADRIDVDRFAAVVARNGTMDRHAFESIEHGFNTLRELDGRATELVHCIVPSGGDLGRCVERALAEIGRAFGAARTVDLSRTGRFRYASDSRSLGSFPYSRWTRAERALAPPLVVEVNGDDFRPGGLVEFLDGSQKIVLVVVGESPPAPLVHCLLPNTFVVQTTDPAALAPLLTWPGPAVGALVGEDAARFVHDPNAGVAVWQRLTIEAVPPHPPRQRRARLSTTQQAEQLAQLESLARPPDHGVEAVTPGEAPVAESPADPAGKLASWLLSQADLSDLE